MMRKFRNIKQIVGNPPHNLPDLCIRIIGIPQPLQVIKGILPHIRFNIYAHHMSHIRHKILRSRINQPQNQVQRPKLQHQRNRKRRQVIHCQICDRAQNQRQYQIAQTGQSRTKQIQNNRFYIFFLVRPKSFYQMLLFSFASHLYETPYLIFSSIIAHFHIKTKPAYFQILLLSRLFTTSLITFHVQPPYFFQLCCL